ncbi:release factor glutamine methyltransferase-like isoform X2 [Rosa chinensis]|uniref:release factor glutamine methyltransferase-like isoform X2 n=1 Tax=Rosa chinensis TaxID=74649 RepID=UPI001AD8F946|nr:release factor glutamine methyltransferase-like isoform X2 [Rosa chinensis]
MGSMHGEGSSMIQWGEHWKILDYSCNEGVLILRSETELIVDLVGDVVKDEEGFREGLWAYLGTGSGAIAIGIGRVLGTGVRVITTDLSLIAISVAGFNVEREVWFTACI